MSALPLTSSALLAGLAAAGALAPIRAQAQADFYAGKSIDLIISTTGGIETNARMVARHLPKHIPGRPTIVPRGMPGAGHIRAANYVFSQAPQDGTVIGTFIPSFILAQVLDRSSNIQFDAARFNWLASTSSSNSTVYTWHTSGIRSLEDAMKRPVLMGATGAGSLTVIYQAIMNHLIGTRFKLVMGYKSGSEVGLALQRGEVEGRAGNNFNSLKVENAEWLRTGRINLIGQIGAVRDPEFPDVPLISDFVRSDEDRQVMRLFTSDVQIGRPFVTSPGVPPERVALLRKAFEDLMKDPDYLRESSTARLDVSPVSGIAIQALVADVVKAPPHLVAKAKIAMEARDMVERPGDAR